VLQLVAKCYNGSAVLAGADGYAWRVQKNTETKTCATCGRPFSNRKKWRSRGQWDQVVYCSTRCRGAAG
jgi:hypothetical protein